MAGGADKTGGYITDVSYVAEFYGDHAPTHLNLIAAGNGYRPRPLDEGFTWCDYGCGNGVTANVLAGCYPQGRFYGVDMMGAHINAAEVLSVRGSLDNTTFLRKSFADLTDDDIPPLDFATMHGVLSWIDDANRDIVLKDVAKRLKPGGMLMTGANAMPGWAAKLPMRNMVYSLTKDGTNTLERAETGLKWLQSLKKAEVKYFRDNPALAEAVDELGRLDLRYMAHEYFNVNLRAFYFAELNAMMEAQGLHFVGSTFMFLNMVDLAVPEGLQQEFRMVKSREELEAKRDFIRNETFRRDLWIKGEAFKTEEEWLEVNQELIFGTLLPLEKIDRKVHFGEIQLSYEEGVLAVLLENVADNALGVKDMLKLPGCGGLSPWTRVDAARLLVAGGQVHAFAQKSEKRKINRGTKLTMPPINRGIIKEMGLRSATVPLAAPVAGTGVEIPNVDAMLLLAMCDKGWGDQGIGVSGRGGPVPFAARLMAAEGGDVVIGGKVLPPKEIETLLTARLKNIEDNLLDKLVELGVVGVEE
jgi:2-polyprenyl-3-methyl-5-hydroxy-6-metoxy-1,4-benzoquinol methylase